MPKAFIPKKCPCCRYRIRPGCRDDSPFIDAGRCPECLTPFSFVADRASYFLAMKSRVTYLMGVVFGWSLALVVPVCIVALLASHWTGLPFLSVLSKTFLGLGALCFVAAIMDRINERKARKEQRETGSDPH